MMIIRRRLTIKEHESQAKTDIEQTRLLDKAVPWEKTCTNCHELKPLFQFARQAKGKFGRRATCRECTAAEARVYEKLRRALNPQKQKDEWQRWAGKNREYLRARSKQQNKIMRASFPEKVKARQKAWRIKNPEKFRASYRASKAKNPDHYRNLSRRWRAANRELTLMNVRRAKAQRRCAAGKFYKRDIDRIFSQQRGRCAYYYICQTDLKLGFHIDHIIPISRNGTNFPHNIQLTCRTCNVRKQALDPIEFARRNGALL